MMPRLAPGLLRTTRWLVSGGLSLPLLALIWVYRLFISPLLGSNCRHLPTCSEYAQDAIRIGTLHVVVIGGGVGGGGEIGGVGVGSVGEGARRQLVQVQRQHDGECDE